VYSCKTNSGGDIKLCSAFVRSDGALGEPLEMRAKKGGALIVNLDLWRADEQGNCSVLQQRID